MQNILNERSMNFSYDSSLAKFAILILLILAVAFLIDFLLVRSIFGKVYRIFVAPGIILHELAHAFMCLLTGAKMSNISFFEKDGGSVEHTASKVPIFGALLISLAPFGVGALAIYFLSRKLGFQTFDLQSMNISQNGIMLAVKSIFKNIALRDWKNWVIFYLILSIAVTMTPSWQDFKNIIGSLLTVGIVVFLISHFHLINFSSISVPTAAFTLLSTVLLLLILSLILSIIIYVLSILFKPV